MTYRELQMHISLMSEEDKDLEIEVVDFLGPDGEIKKFVHRVDGRQPFIEVS